MPRKYKSMGVLMPGFSAPPEVLKAQMIERDRQIQARKDKRLARKFLAEPEELKILDAIEKLPTQELRHAAAEGALLGRRFKILGLNKK